MTNPAVRRQPRTRVWTAVVLGLALLVLAASLRAGVSSVGVLLPDLRTGLGLSAPTVSLLTSLPVWCFAVVGLGGGRVILRLGVHRATVLLLAAVVIGLVARSLTQSTAGFLLATAVAMAGTALGNVVLPPLAKQHFPNRLGLVSGLYGAALLGGSAVPAALTAPIAEAADSWRFALGSWAGVGVLALLLWLPTALRDSRPATIPGSAPDPHSLASVMRTKLGWAMAICFGGQSSQAYVQFGYWGDILADEGVDAAHAGALLGLLAGTAIPVAIVLPTLIRLTHGSVVLPVAFGALTAVGWVGMIATPMALDGWLWAIVLGAGGGSFTWCLAMIGLRSQTSAGAAQLSAFTQGGGYLVAATVTFTAGMLRDATGSWTAPIGVLIALAVAIMVAGAVAVRSRPVEAEL